MRKFLMGLTVLAGAVTVGTAAQAAPRVADPAPVAASAPALQPVHYWMAEPAQYWEDWRHREWRRREEFERFRRHQAERHWRHEQRERYSRGW